MRMLNLLALLVLLNSCGKQADKWMEENAGEEKPGDDSPTGKSDGEEYDSDTIKALTFKGSVQLDGVSAIYSAAKIINTLYFTGLDLEGNTIVGKVKPNSSKAEILPVGRLGTTALPLKGKYVIPTNLDDALYIMNNEQIVEIDLLTMKAVGKITSKCAILAPLTYLEDSRWTMIWNNKKYVCGMLDGAVISSGPVVDGYTAQALEFDNYSSFSFDSIYAWKYNSNSETLVKYQNDFSKVDVYSTGSYLYNGQNSVFVSDTQGHMWFLGCDKAKACFQTEASVVEQ